MGNIFINSAQNNSGVHIGYNMQMGWSSHSKQLTNITNNGTTSNFMASNYNIVVDNDLLDAPNADGDRFGPGI